MFNSFFTLLKRGNLISAAAVLAVLAVTAACGGGGGGGSATGDSMTVSVDATTTPYTEGAINGYGYYDPEMEADVSLSSGRTYIILSSGVTGTGQPSTVINIVTNGHTAGVYPVTGDGSAGSTTYLYYRENSEVHKSVISSGTVTIDSFGNVGERVAGSFSSVVLCSSPSHSHVFSGTFNVTRAN